MQDKIQTGRGHRRRREIDDDELQPSEVLEPSIGNENEISSRTEEPKKGDDNESKGSQNGHVDNHRPIPAEEVPERAFSPDSEASNIKNAHINHNNTKPQTRTPSQLRDTSRKEYLKKRQQSKLEQLNDEIAKLESRHSSLSQAELNEYNKRKHIIQTIQEALKDGYTESGGFHLQEGTQDRKRKHELLHAKTEYDDRETDLKSHDSAKKNRYENQWELDQMKKATQLSTTDTDKINLPNQDQYEFVFDESQFVTFDEDKPLAGDEPEEPEEATTEKKKMSLLEVRNSLPVYKFKDEFLETVKQNQVLIVVGETGSGKTTQLPQYLHEAGYSKRKDSDRPLIIGCTQPRRVAATSVATRVAEEFGCKLGEEVGYTVRFDDASNANKTVIKYLTDGMLLREFLNDPELTNYGALMIDEAHERTLSTEILLSLLKDIVQARSDLKLIVASATINATKFSEFFNNAPILNIPGRRFPVEIHYTKNPEANYIQAAITTIFQIHLTQDIPGDILVFLTGQEEIETMEESLNESVQKLGSQIKPLLICSIYANLPNEAQAKIFEPTPPNSRKVVLATNIAETSITINGIAYVIDPGYVKQNVFNASTGMESLVVVPCSRASADQRAGRAGRVGPGKCFRLYTKWSFYNELDLNPVPEILRVKLTSVVLLLLSLGINDLINFDFMDPPSSEAIIKSLELLYSLGALNSSGELTKVGRKMAEFPIDPMFTKALLQSSKYGVFNEILTIMSMLGESSTLYYRPKDKREQADKAHEKFSEEQGDHLTLLKIWNEWADTGYSNAWCQDSYIQYKTLKRVRNIREQLERLCKRVGIGMVQDQAGPEENKTAMIQKTIVSGFFPNLARLSKMGDSFRRLKQNQAVFIHPSSSLHSLKPPPKVVLYHELVLTSKEFMRNCMIIEEKWIKEFASHYYNAKELEFVDKSGKGRYKGQ